MLNKTKKSPEIFIKFHPFTTGKDFKFLEKFHICVVSRITFLEGILKFQDFPQFWFHFFHFALLSPNFPHKKFRENLAFSTNHTTKKLLQIASSIKSHETRNSINIFMIQTENILRKHKNRKKNDRFILLLIFLFAWLARFAWVLWTFDWIWDFWVIMKFLGWSAIFIFKKKNKTN
jgi:hypothetical protein